MTAALPPLTPGQAHMLESVDALIGRVAALYVTGPHGCGKSTILRHLAARRHARLLTATDAMHAFNTCQPAHLEEALIGLVRDAFETADVVAFDDWWSAASFALIAPDRPFFFFQATAALFAELATCGKTFIATVAVGHDLLLAGAAGLWIPVPPFAPADRRTILEHHLGGRITDDALVALDRAYRDLDGYQVSSIGAQLRDRDAGTVTGDDLVALLDRTIDAANVTLDDVDDVTTRRLIGSETAIETLERTVIVPMTDPDLAQATGMIPARGILLHGPPGTGKTTLGRLLAHRLDGRFFVIDGTMFADRGTFPHQVNRLLRRAAASSPSVVFIDDADVIFRNGQARGFARQLLSKLDGLAGESQRGVCLVMTAMDVADMPPAIVRSGRVDVWIEMRPPDATQRAAIIQALAGATTTATGAFDATVIANACDGFTPADLNALVGEASGALAYDLIRDAPARPFDDYLAEAATEIAARKRLIGV